MKIYSANMNRSFLAKLEDLPGFSKIEDILYAGDPPSKVRERLEGRGISPSTASKIVKGLWDLKSSKLLVSEEELIEEELTTLPSGQDQFVDYLSHAGTSQDNADIDFCPFQLAVGVLVELEHTDNFDIAKEIAKDHLVEDPDYYGKFNFPEEAVEQITDNLDDFEPTEVSASVIKEVKPFLHSVCSAAHKANISLPPYLYIDSNSLGAKVIESEKTGKFWIPTPVTEKIASDVPFKTIEEYYKKGILSPKEVIGILTKENGWPEGEARVIVDFFERAYGKYNLTPVYYNEDDGSFQPGDESEEASAVADNMNDVYEQEEPAEFVLAWVDTVKNHREIFSREVEFQPGYMEPVYYYRRAQNIPSFEDFIGYLRFTGQFEDYSSAHKLWEKVCEELSRI